jgi:hypothetical protein
MDKHGEFPGRWARNRSMGAALRSLRGSRTRPVALLLLIITGLALGGGLWANFGNASPSQRLGRLTSSQASSTSAAQCSAVQLSLSTHSLSKAMSGSYTRYTITNTGTTACTIGGVPTLAWQASTSVASGSSSSPVAFPQRAAATASAGTLTLAANEQASFWVFYPVCGTVTPTVADPGRLVVSFSTMSGSLSLAEGTPDCDHNEVTVSALQPGVMEAPPGFTTTTAPKATPIRITPPTEPKPNLETTPYSERVYYP